MSVFGDTAAFGGNKFFENIKFGGEINQSLNRADASIGSVRIRALAIPVDVLDAVVPA